MAKNIPITFRWLREVIDHEWDRKDRKSVCAICFVLLKYADADGQNCFPSVATVAFEAGVSEETVRRIYKTMRGKGYLRKTAKTQDRYRTNIYRLIYPTPSGEIPLGGGVSTVKSAGTTKGTESPTGDDSSPDGDFVAPPPTSQAIISNSPTVSETIIADSPDIDEGEVAMNYLRPYFEGIEPEKVPETRNILAKYEDIHRQRFNDLTKSSIFNDLIRKLGYEEYEQVIGVLSGQIKDKKIVAETLENPYDLIEIFQWDALFLIKETYARWRAEHEHGWYDDSSGYSSVHFEIMGYNFSEYDRRWQYCAERLLRLIGGERKSVLERRNRVEKPSSVQADSDMWDILEHDISQGWTPFVLYGDEDQFIFRDLVKSAEMGIHVNIPDGRPVGGDPIITLDIVESAEVVADSGEDLRW